MMQPQSTVAPGATASTSSSPRSLQPPQPACTRSSRRVLTGGCGRRCSARGVPAPTHPLAHHHSRHHRRRRTLRCTALGGPVERPQLLVGDVAVVVAAHTFQRIVNIVCDSSFPGWAAELATPLSLNVLTFSDWAALTSTDAACWVRTTTSPAYGVSHQRPT